MDHTTHTTPESIDEIGGNPHAEIPSEPIALVPDWREAPSAFLEHHKGTPESVSAGVSEALRSMDGTSADADSALRLLATLSSMLPRYRRTTPESGAHAFLEFGPVLVPTSPLGLATLATLRAHAERRIEERPMGEIAEQGSTLAPLARAFDSVSSMRTSRLVDGTRNRTTRAGEGFRFGVSIDARTMASMPRGETLPLAILSPALVGAEITDARTLQRDADMCDDGTAEFLERFGIGFERDPGTYECDSCGSEHESDESGEIESIDDFVLTAEMVDFLERGGYADAVREHIGATDGTDEWGGMLDSCDDAEILERCAPDAEHGIRFDSLVWDFAPDFESIDGIETLEWSEQARALPLVVRIADAHTSAGVLPPIGGTLTLRERYGAGSDSDSARAGRVFVWNPERGTLTHAITDSLALLVDVRHGGATLVLRVDGAESTVALEPNGGEWTFHAHAGSAGEHAARLCALFQGSARV